MFCQDSSLTGGGTILLKQALTPNFSLIYRPLSPSLNGSGYKERFRPHHEVNAGGKINVP